MNGVLLLWLEGVFFTFDVPGPTGAGPPSPFVLAISSLCIRGTRVQLDYQQRAFAALGSETLASLSPAGAARVSGVRKRPAPAAQAQLEFCAP